MSSLVQLPRPSTTSPRRFLASQPSTTPPDRKAEPSASLNAFSCKAKPRGVWQVLQCPSPSTRYWPRSSAARSAPFRSLAAGPFTTSGANIQRHTVSGQRIDMGHEISVSLFSCLTGSTPCMK
ncbi:hypothetical protein D3C73_1111590 [compost metagenome]